MAYSAQNEETHTQFSTPIFQPSSHRSQSFSSLSSFSSTTSSSLGSFSNIYDDDHYFPTTTPRTPLRISGIPFSWEQIPGIPKQQISNKSPDSSSSLHRSSLLPLPPAGNYSSYSTKKYYNEEISPKKFTTGSDQSFRKDPFFTALVECSKDDDHDHTNGGYWKAAGSKVTKTLNMYMTTSCRTTCAVSDSVVYLPRSRTYNLLTRRRSSTDKMVDR